MRSILDNGTLLRKVYVPKFIFPVSRMLLSFLRRPMGLILASLFVSFRAVTHLYGIVTLAWMYGTPIFYPIESIQA